MAGQIRKLHRSGLSKSEISRRLNIGRTSVRRILAAQPKLKLTCLPLLRSTAGNSRLSVVSGISTLSLLAAMNFG